MRFLIICLSLCFFYFASLYVYNPQHVDWLYSGNKNMSFCDFSNADLSGLTITHKTDFSFSNFSGAILNRSSFYKCNFYKANFCSNEITKRRTCLKNSFFDNCKFDYSEMENVDASDCEFRICSFRFSRSCLSSFIRSYFYRVDANRATFFGSDFSGVVIENSNFSDVFFNFSLNLNKSKNSKGFCNMPAKLNDCILRNSNFKRAKFNEVKMNNSELIDVDLSFCQAYSIEAQSTIFYLTNFFQIILDGSKFLFSEFYMSPLTRARSCVGLAVSPNSIHDEELYTDFDEELNAAEGQRAVYDEQSNFYNQKKIKVKDFYNKEIKFPEKIFFEESCFCGKRFKSGEYVAVFCCCGKTCCQECANKTLSTPCYYEVNKMKETCPFCKTVVRGYARCEHF